MKPHDKTNGLGQTIKALRRMRRLTQDQLANRAGISRTAIVNIEGGHQTLTVQSINNIAGALGYAVHVRFVQVAP